MNESIHVLHVDDEPDFAETARTFLERQDDRIQVEIATSASEGLDRLADDIDCIISDYDMPGQNGITLLETVRETHPDLPFILFTGKGSEKVASEAISAGVTEYLQKKSNPEQYELLANRIRNVVGQDRATRRADNLQRIRSFVNNINQTLVRADSREEIETRICKIISESEPYLFAWLGEVEPETDRIEPREVAGVADEYFDKITITVDESPTGQGPAGKAVRDRHITVSQTVQEDSEFDPWREELVERDVQSLAAIPLEYEDTLYGVLAVAADRPHAFDEQERTVLTELSNDIAHAIHAVELRTHLERYKTIVEALGDPVYALDADGHYTFVNDAFMDATEYSHAEIIDKHVSEIVPDTYMEQGQDVIRNLLRSGDHQSATWELERITANGDRIPVENHVALLPAENGEFRGTAGVLRDITDRQQREQELKKSQDRFRLVEQYADIGYWELDLQSDPPYESVLTDGIRRIHEVDPDADFTFETGLEFYHPADRPQVKETVTRAIEAGKSFAVEARLRTEKDNICWVRLTGEPVKETGETVALRGTLQDITERKHHERNLRQSHRQFEAIFNSPDSFIGVVNPDGTLRKANQTALEFADVDPAEIEGKPFWETPWWTHSEDLQHRLQNWIEQAATGEHVRFEAPHYAPDGEKVIADGVLRPVTDETGETVVLVVEARDITDRKEREQAIEDLHSTAQAVMQTQNKEEVAEIVVQALDDILNMPINGIWFHDETRNLLQPIGSSQRATEVLGDLPTFRAGEGLAWKVFETGEYKHFDDVSTESKRFNPDTNARSEIILPIGQHGIITIGSTSTDAFDEVDVSLAQTVAAHTETALDRLEREQELEQQNERLEEFASILSHDLRNPLNVLAGSLDLAEKTHDSEHFTRCQRAVNRMEQLISDLQTLAREGKEVAEPETVDLAAVAESCWQTIATSDAELIINTNQIISADKGRIKQVLENLFCNAVKHAGEDVTVTVGNIENKEGFYVEDDGPGIPETRREHAFDMGFSTRTDGTGFGLSIVKRIVQAHGWEVSVTEGEDNGARFEITHIEVNQ